MAGFVNAAPGHVIKILFINAGSNAHIMGIKTGAERMFAYILPAGFKIKMQFFYQVHAPVPLILFWKMLL